MQQRQDSVTDQLKDLYQLANENGMYDAADFVRSTLEDSRNGNWNLPVWAPAPLGTQVTENRTGNNGKIVGYSVDEHGESVLIHFPDLECAVIDEDGIHSVNPIYFKTHYQICTNPQTPPTPY